MIKKERANEKRKGTDSNVIVNRSNVVKENLAPFLIVGREVS